MIARAIVALAQIACDAMPRVEPNPGKPWCKFGYTGEQIKEITGERHDDFIKWFYGQTGAICDGEWPCSVSHGMVVYEWDVERFLRGGRIID